MKLLAFAVTMVLCSWLGASTSYGGDTWQFWVLTLPAAGFVGKGVMAAFCGD